ncbi:SET and MYND domain-containing protein 4 [Malaya genurostris]|uniref:SET and MYND domain-containing protein 4 n=1 Tax=Malaya genurostris TaxID=325434 RepID=UPI0026F3F57A|nr:SET and MYND domain-containing protein 4 [Malaya genurostris]XP_058460513.1 SET and MYND domain-containing protein 4 [Malaya genurostris]XP_058460514.1 SET and MYND domain-containing protein 4 [Malaya genurostris]XP_058460515.1 SET and MYND domain-containing protein 4 [Malaya genurostris]XP_058460516.1 SET and MYND domain-containing protein 4 [Malaya genurostris]
MDAYDLYSKLWRKVVISGQEKQISTELKACKNNSEIIYCVRQLLDKSGLMQQIQFTADGKNESRAIECRKLGNKSFHPKIKKYIKALEYYNESIALSHVGSESLAIAYANRSVICFELKEYRDCLENIRLTQLNSYPEHLLPKLLKRKEDCLAMINNIDLVRSNHILHEPKLSYKPNSKIPHIAECLELKEDGNFGRCLVTNRNLKAGDLLIMEKPFSAMLEAKLCYLNCDYCQRDQFLTLIPCNSCSVTMFCSEKCLEKAYDEYHRIECSIIKHLRLLFSKVILMALRTTTMAISTFNFDLGELLQHVESLEVQKLSPFDFDWRNIHAKEIYSTIHLLATNQTLRSPSDLTQRAIYSIIISEALLSYTPLKSLCGTSESHRNLIRVLIFRHAQTSPVNMHSTAYMNYCPEEVEEFQHSDLGCASFPILSMINHSCAPNLVRMTLPTGQVVALLNRPIKKGGQLFDNYGYHHCLEILSERQISLDKQYCFKCQCEACKNNYPLYYDLQHAKLLPGHKNPISAGELDILRKHDIAMALKKIPEYCDFLNDYDSQYPNYEVSSVQEALLRCFQIVYSSQSRKMKYRGLCSI